MTTPPHGESRAKDARKVALAEVMEDIAFARAIREGESSEPVSRDEVFRLLESGE